MKLNRKPQRQLPTLTSVFFNRSAFRCFVRNEVTENAKAEVLERFSDGSGLLLFCNDWANGFESRLAMIDFPIKVALRILRKESVFCRDAGQQRKAA